MDALAALLQGVFLLALAVWAGGLVTDLVVLRPARRASAADVALLEPSRRRIQALMWWALVALLLALAGDVVRRAVAAHDPHGFLAALRNDVLFGSRYGIASAIRWPCIVAALWIVDEMRRAPSAVRPVRPRAGSHALGIVAARPHLLPDRLAGRLRPTASSLPWRRVTAVLALAVIAATAVAGPYGDVPVRALADALHLGATVLWLGGSIVIAVAMVPVAALVERERRHLAVLGPLDRFTPLAALCVLIVVPTGLWEATQRVHPSANGLPFALKALIVAVMVVISAGGNMILRPRLRRLALRARRDQAVVPRVSAALKAVLRPMRVNAWLAVAALALGAVLTAAPIGTARAERASRATTRPAAGPSWQPLGPATIAYAFVVDPSNHARLLEGTTGGVYRSLDHGARWRPASTGLSDGGLDVYSLSYLPDGSLIAATGAGVYRSTDGGSHWKQSGLASHAIYTLATHLSGHIVLLAGGAGGIYRSDDLARTWRQIYNSGRLAVSSLAWPAIRPALVVAGTVPGDQPLVISRDGGTTWRLASRGLPAGPGVMSVAVAPGARAVYAGMMGLGAFASPGISGAWQRRDTGLPGLKTEDAHIASFAFTPYNAATIYAATPFGVYSSSDAGAHWSPLGHGLTGFATDVTGLTLETGARPALYAATANGLYRLQLALPKRQRRLIAG